VEIEPTRTVPERRLDSGDRRFLWLALLIGAASLAVGLWLYPRVNPEASIRFGVDRADAQQAASAFLRDLGHSVEGYRHAGQFTYDDEAKVFLERTLGLEGFQDAVDGPVRLWRWSNRWFRPLQTEEFRVEIATTGERVGFEHTIAEDAPGASLELAAARTLAESFLREQISLDLTGLELLDQSSEQRKARTDHRFVWKQRAVDWRGGTARCEVRVQGDAIGAYREWVQAPEAWTREYSALRARNDAAAVVAAGLLLLTLAATVVVTVRRMRAGDIRWNVAAAFAVVGGVLAMLSMLNALPNQLFGYETTQSFGGFLSLQLLGALGFGLGIGVFILVPAAAGESLYRRAYPEKLTLDGFFSLRGLRTRRFLLSSVLGLTLTCFFFAYQEVFYAVALSMGAWAPLDVPYSDLLNTAFPWIFVLLIGFLPAVSEEFLSRMFSIPFVQSLTRSRWLAVLIPAFIWGFAHSNYPNQPFFIRGLEVGLAGVLIGFVMLRVNIGATLIWHFTVDALYTSVLLFRSGNAYYIVSAAIASGLILLPLGYAVFSYWKRGGFEDPAGLRNADLGSVEPTEGEPEAAPAEVAVTPWSRPARSAALAFAVISLFALVLPTAKLERAQRLQLSRGEAETRAVEIARMIGLPVDSLRTATTWRAPYDEALGRYILDHGGAERWIDDVSRLDLAFRWRTRFYRPLSPREATIEIDPETGGLLRYESELAEADPRGALSEAAAESLGRARAEGFGFGLVGLERIEAKSEIRPARVDRSFLWQAPDGDARNPGDAHYRLGVTWHGDEFAGIHRGLELPEAWLREHDKQTVWSALRVILAIGVSGGALGYLLWRLVVEHRAGAVPWRRAFRWAVPFGLLGAAAALGSWPDIQASYPTQLPWNLYLVTASVGLALGVALPYVLAACGLALVGASYPGIWSLVGADARRALGRPAFLAAFITLLALLSLEHLQGWLIRAHPTLAPTPDVNTPTQAGALFPWMSMVNQTWRQTLMVLVGAAGAIAVYTGESNSRRRSLLWLLLLVLAATPIDAHSREAFLGGFLIALARALVAWLLARHVLRDNLLSYALAAYAAIGAQVVSPFVGAQGAWFQTQGWIATGLLAIPIVWALWPAIASASTGATGAGQSTNRERTSALGM